VIVSYLALAMLVVCYAQQQLVMKVNTYIAVSDPCKSLVISRDVVDVEALALMHDEARRIATNMVGDVVLSMEPVSGAVESVEVRVGGKMVAIVSVENA